MALGDPYLARSEGPGLREMVRAALLYWEPRRLIYNAVLLAVTLYVTRGQLAGHWNEMIIACAGANVCYCLAYPIDLVAQWTQLGVRWVRPVVLVCGCVLAAALANSYLFFVLHPMQT